MADSNHLKRRGRRDSGLGERVFMAVVSFAGAALLGLVKNILSELGNYRDEVPERYGYFLDGTPWPENSEDEHWEAYYGKDVNRI